MSQSPIVPPAPTAKAPARSVTAAETRQTLDSGEPAESSAFTATMQEMMETTESAALPGLAWGIALPMEQLMNASQLLNGSVMPGQSASGGNSLPFQVTDSLSAQSALLKPGVLPEFQSDLLMEKFLGQVDRSSVLTAINPSADGMLEGFDLRGAGEQTSQIGLTGLQGLGSVLSGRSAHLSLSVDVPVAQPGWDKAIGERIQWMIGREIQNAEIKLTPPNLGPLEIRISVQNDQASVSFIAAQSLTREALEAAIPRLREMFGEANLNLLDVGVGQGDGSDSNSGGMPGRDGGESANSGMRESNLSNPQDAMLSRYASDGIVDDYA